MGRLVRARKTYNRTWRRVDKLYGRNGAPPPPAVFLDKKTPRATSGVMWVGNTEDSGHLDTTKPRSVYITPGQRRVLGRSKKGYQGGRRAAQKRLLHEWQHMNQPEELINDPNPWLRERDASQFARRGARKMLRPRRK